MTKTRFRREMSKLSTMKREADALYEKLDRLMGYNIGSSALHESYYRLFDHAVAQLSELAGDGFQFVSWWFFDKPRSAPGIVKIKGEKITVKTSGQLWEVIRAVND